MVLRSLKRLVHKLAAVEIVARRLCDPTQQAIAFFVDRVHILPYDPVPMDRRDLEGASRTMRSLGPIFGVAKTKNSSRGLMDALRYR